MRCRRSGAGALHVLDLMDVFRQAVECRSGPRAAPLTTTRIRIASIIATLLLCTEYRVLYMHLRARTRLIVKLQWIFQPPVNAAFDWLLDWSLHRPRNGPRNTLVA